MIFVTNPSTNLWLWAAITASISFAFAAISAASPVITPLLSSVAGEWVNAITISAPSALTIWEYLSKVSIISKNFNPITFSAFVLVNVSGVAIPINATLTPSTSVIIYGTA